MLNENQHKLLQNTAVQMIIQQLNCEPLHEPSKQTKAISTRITKWQQEFKNNSAKPESNSNNHIQQFITKQQEINGNQWCPF